MPQPTGATGRSHVAHATIDDLAHRLGTDPDRGLSPKEAARRLAESDTPPLFGKEGKNFSACLKLAFREPVLWILLAVAVVALFFDRVAVGLVCILLTLVNGLICAWAHHYAERVDQAMQTYDAPLTRVLRNGRVLRVPADGIVRGDVILLYPGDVLPADVRLLTSRDLVVAEYALDDHKRSERMLLSKNAAAMPTEMPRHHSPEHMIFAGAVVERGHARALVVEVGLHTHVGALSGGIEPMQTDRVPRAYRRARRYISLWNLLLAFVILPVTAIGIFTLGSRFDLLDLFLTSLALAVVSLTEHVLAQGLFMGAYLRADAATVRDADNAVEIKTSVAAEALADVDHLVLIGTAGLHDGTLRTDSVTVAGETYAFPNGEPDDAAVALSEHLYLWKKALTDRAGLPREEDAALFYAIDEINRWAAPDTDALQVRVKQMSARWGEVTVTFRDGHTTYLRITADFADVDGCHRAATARGRIPFDGTCRYDWYRAYGQAMHGGRQAYFLISETDGVSCAEGMITLSTHVCRKTLGCIRDLEESGICVTAFLRDVSEENTRVLEACGLTAHAPAGRPVPETDRPSARMAVQKGVRAFEGCDTAFIRRYIEDIHADGGRVGVLSVEARDLPLLDAADVAITCAPNLFAEAMNGELSLVGTDGSMPAADGLPQSAYATDLSRRRARVIVRRSNVHGGGVCGVREAFLTATRLSGGLRRAVRFLLVSHLLRLVTVLLPVILGLTLLSAPSVLISGLLVDLLAVLCYTVADRPLSPDDPAAGGLTSGLDRPHRTFLPDLVAAAVAAVLPWIPVGIATLSGHSFGASTAYIAFLSLNGTQIALFLTGRPSRRNRLTFFVTLVMVCLYVGGVAMALSVGLHPLWSLLCPLASPAAYLAVRCVFSVVRRMQTANTV